jgi:hypothetical protein
MSAETIAHALGLRRAGYQGFAVTEKQGCTLFHCHACGCTQADVIGALQKAGLWPREADECRRPSRDKWPARRS